MLRLSLFYLFVCFAVGGMTVFVLSAWFQPFAVSFILLSAIACYWTAGKLGRVGFRAAIASFVLAAFNATD